MTIVKDRNGRQMKIGTLVTPYGRYKGKIFKIVAITRDYQLNLQGVWPNMHCIHRYYSQVRKLEIEELI